MCSSRRVVFHQEQADPQYALPLYTRHVQSAPRASRDRRACSHMQLASTAVKQLL